jgi:hypothetical protein
MPRISYAFFSVAALCGLAGMMWGIHMGVTEDFATAPAHAHINLAGWTSLSIMGGFYALDRTTPHKLGWVNFALSALGGITLPLGIFLITSGHPAQGGPVSAIGGSAAFLGMLTFVIVVLGGWRRAGRA